MSAQELAWQKIDAPGLSHPLSWAEGDGVFYVASGQTPWFCLQDETLRGAVRKAREILGSYDKFKAGSDATSKAPPSRS